MSTKSQLRNPNQQKKGEGTMKSRISKVKVAIQFGVCVFMFISIHAWADLIIYQEGFSGTTGNDFNGNPADVALGQYGGTANATWTAEPSWDFTADGKVQYNTAVNHGMAFLPFTPESGLVYTLTATLKPPGTGNDWAGVGFYTSTESLTSAPNSAKTGMIVRGGGTFDPWFMPGTIYGDYTTADNGLETLQIVLDTTDEYWTASGTFLSSGHTASYTWTTAGNPGIGKVGFGSYQATGATMDDFMLTVFVIPEPGTTHLLLGMAAVLLTCMRRRGSRA